MTLSDPNPGFKVTGYLKVEYLADGARVFYCTKHSCRSLGALPKTCKKIGGRRWKFFSKSAGRCFTPLIEIKHNSVSLRSNFYAYIQLIRGRFWLQLWTVKKFSEPVAPAAAGRLQAVKRTDCWPWLTVTPMSDRL